MGGWPKSSHYIGRTIVYDVTWPQKVNQVNQHSNFNNNLLEVCSRKPGGSEVEESLHYRGCEKPLCGTYATWLRGRRHHGEARKLVKRVKRMTQLGAESHSELPLVLDACFCLSQPTQMLLGHLPLLHSDLTKTVLWATDIASWCQSLFFLFCSLAYLGGFIWPLW